MSIFRRWFAFDIRHTSGGFEQLAAELQGLEPSVYRTTGKVSACTKWGARRIICKNWGPCLIEIVGVERVAS